MTASNEKFSFMTDLPDQGSVDFVDSPTEEQVEPPDPSSIREAVLYATDWTTETIVSQLKRNNIALSPSFQRRDAWKTGQKSRFIESLMLGLPIPQIVLAEEKEHRGKFIVLDGKQRLLSILQFWRLGKGAKNGYALSGLELRTDLNGKSLANFEQDARLEDELNSLLNQPIRTVVIRNWPSADFLHLVFLRLNTGSLKLSPQELRQALFPGPFSDWIDEAAAGSEGIKRLLRLDEPDYRMRDIEVLSRYFAFKFFLPEYSGRMKKFLDRTFERFNKQWDEYRPLLASALEEFEAVVDTLFQVFGPSVGRKPGSRHFNRAVFDFLSFYAQQSTTRDKMKVRIDDIQNVYNELFGNSSFRAAVERDTAGAPNTVMRLAAWGTALSKALGMELPKPELVEEGGENRIIFSGF